MRWNKHPSPRFLQIPSNVAASLYHSVMPSDNPCQLGWTHGHGRVCAESVQCSNQSSAHLARVANILTKGVSASRSEAVAMT